MDITRFHGLCLPAAAHDRLIASYLCFLHAREPAGDPVATKGPLSCPPCVVCRAVWQSIIIHNSIRTIFTRFLCPQPCYFAAMFIRDVCLHFFMEAPTSPQKRPRFDGGSDVLYHVLRDHVRTSSKFVCFKHYGNRGNSNVSHMHRQGC